MIPDLHADAAGPALTIYSTSLDLLGDGRSWSLLLGTLLILLINVSFGLLFLWFFDQLFGLLFGLPLGLFCALLLGLLFGVLLGLPFHMHLAV